MAGRDERAALWRPRLPRMALDDVVAGLSVALVLVPQSLAYAVLAGMPPVTGLVTGAVATIAAAPYVSSPYLQTGPVAITSLLTFGALSALATPATDEYVALAALLAVLVGVVRIAIGLLRAGALAYLMSHPVLAGFTPAAAIVIAASQLPRFVGVPTDARTPLDVVPAIADPTAWDLPTVGIGAVTLTVLLAARRAHRLFPAVLVAVVVGWGVAAVIGYDGPTVGGVAGGLPTPHGDWPLAMLPQLLVPAVVIALVGFAEPAAIARTYAQQTRQRWDADREFVGQGMANLASGLFGGFPAGGSFSRTAVGRAAGARTAWSGAVSGLAVLAVMPFVGVFERLPVAVLAAIIIASVLKLVTIAELRELQETSPRQLFVAALTLVLTIVLAPQIQVAVVVGVLASIGIHLYRELSITTPHWRDDSTLHVRPAGVLYFGSTHRLEDEFTALVGDHPDIDRLVVHVDRLGRIDVTGALALRRMGEHLEEAGVTLVVEDTTHASELIVDRVMPDPVD